MTKENRTVIPSLLNSDTSSHSTSSSPFVTIYRHLNNMGASLRCPLCLHTLRGTPILLPCIHAFCHECILEHFTSSPLKSRHNESKDNMKKIQKLCPVCKAPASKRSIQPSPHLRDLVLGYKSTLKSFGIVPVIYDEAANIHMTQIAPSSQSDSNDVKSDDINKNKCKVSRTEMKEHLQVSRAWMMELQKCDSAQDKEIDWLKKHQKTVVSVDENALMNHDDPLHSNLKSKVVTSSSINDEKHDDQQLNSKEAKISIHKTQLNSNTDNDNEIPGNLNDINDSNNQSSSKEQDKLLKKTENTINSKSLPLENLSLSTKKSKQTEENPKNKVSQNMLNNNKLDSLSTSNHKNYTKTEYHNKSLVSDTNKKDQTECEQGIKLPAEAEIKRVQHKNERKDKGSESKYFQPGSIVSVQARTWPGSNKQGGVARILKVYPELNSYDVIYVLGGREKKVSGEFVTSVEDHQGTNSRQRKRNREMKKIKVVKCERYDEKSISIAKKQKIEDKENNVIACSMNQRENEGRNVEKKSRETLDGKVNEKRKNNEVNKAKGFRLIESEIGDKKTSREIQKLTEEMYADKIDRAVKSGVVYIVMSNVTDYVISLVDVLIMEMKRKDVILKVLKDLNGSKKPTLCITSALPENPTTSASRTLKTMCCALTCTPILTQLWITSSLEEKNLVHPKDNMYIKNLPTRTTSIEDGGKLQEYSKLGVSRFICREEKLLEDIHVIICGAWKIGAKKSDIKLLLKECGASTHSTMKTIPKPLKDRKIIMLCDDSENAVTPTLYKASEIVLRDKDKDSLLIVGGSWLFDCISCSCLLDGKDYSPKGTKSKELWRMQY